MQKRLRSIGAPIATNGLQLPEGREFENEITLKNWRFFYFSCLPCACLFMQKRLRSIGAPIATNGPWLCEGADLKVRKYST